MENINSLAGILLVFISLLANAYWQDAIRWENEKRKALEAGKKEHLEYARKCVRNAMLLFRFSTFIGFATVLSILFVFHPREISEWIVYIILWFLLIALIFFTITPKYFSSLGFPDKLGKI